jgi:glucose-1-phosphate thymidylyltransferase
MKALVLGAGYGTRLYPLTISTPKALLKIGGRTILDRLVDNIFSVKECTGAYIVSNDLFYENFCEWAENKKTEEGFADKTIEVVNDGTMSNEDRLGAIGDIAFGIEKFNITEDFMVLGSDNLFDMKLSDFCAFAKSKDGSASLALHDIQDIDMAHLYGIAIVEEASSKILDFQEKPKLPKSTLAATAVYYYPKTKLEKLEKYMETDLSKDAPGNFIKWLSTKEDVFGYVFKENWYDIGDKSSLKKADNEFFEKEK